MEESPEREPAPFIHVEAAPPQPGSSLSEENTEKILSEAKGVLKVFHQLTDDDFAKAGIPAVQDVTEPMEPLLFDYDRSTMAHVAVQAYLSNPGPECPTIDALSEGTRICTLMYKYSDGARDIGVNVPIFRGASRIMRF